MKKRLTNSYALWTVQELLTVLFLFAGVMKLVPLLEVLTQLGHALSLPDPFSRFIGVTEMLDTVRLILTPVLALVIVGSLSTFIAYGRSASAQNKKSIEPVDSATFRSTQQ